jgi:ubiquinone/menaquinone biosynthesis C-methylase UbiE
MNDQTRQSEALARAHAMDDWGARWNNIYEAIIAFGPVGKRLRKAIPHLRGPRVLEVSFGTGYLMEHYAANFETTGLDLHPDMLAVTRRRLDAKGIKATLVQGDAQSMPFDDESFETLVNSDAFTLYPDSKKAMSEFYRVLVPGGRLVLLEYDYPSDRNWLGMQLMRLPQWLKMPYVDFPQLLRDTGFEFEDHNLGMAGVLHMWVCTKAG